MTPRRTSKLWLAFGGLGIALLAAAVFTLGSLNLPFEPRGSSEIVILFALSTFIVAALLVFGLILTRSLLRLWAERQAGQLGARFKTKMVFGAMAISLLPVVFMFFISYALLNRTLAKWFPRPLEIAAEENQKLLNDLGRAEHQRLRAIAREAASGISVAAHTHRNRKDWEIAIRFPLSAGADACWSFDETGNLLYAFIEGARPGVIDPSVKANAQVFPRRIRALPSAAEIWDVGGNLYLAAQAPPLAGVGRLFVARRLPENFLQHYKEIESQIAAYEAQKQGLRAFKAQMLLTLLLFTVLLLFSATWFALFLSKQVTVPIQALAEATREVSSGNFDHRVNVPAQDELGILVESFNQMTAQLAESRRQIDEFTRNLQQAVEELERRRKLMETILENVPTGVLSLDAAGAIIRANSAILRILGDHARQARTLLELLGEPTARRVEQLMRKSLRMGAASQELEITLPDRVLHAAVTVSSLGPRRANPGFVVVLDDLSELLRAQKAAAWQEVAQRVAHEIKNPLTPIQLSAQRLARQIERRQTNGELERLVGECAALIEREVAALKALVDEFSQFARFPAPRTVPTDLNAIVAGALDVFGGRMDDVRVRTDLARGLPPVKADPELLRRVLVNLIDNAAEAMEGAKEKELAISTRLDAEGEAFEIVVADRGRGISPVDKDKLFLPHFSTKQRGTGLGLAIAGRIIEEHYGTIRVEDNVPCGARFVIRLPATEAQPQDHAVSGFESPADATGVRKPDRGAVEN